jgi:hypothetical protein
LFAFIIVMPTLHRLACFRDDIIFFIFLYQKWVYRVDYKRVNEFGTVLVSEEEQKRIEDEDRAEREKKERESAAASAVSSDASPLSEAADEPEAADLAAAEEEDEGLRQRSHAAANDVD